VGLVCDGCAVTVIEQRDLALRAMTDDGSFRVVSVDATQCARGIIAAQRAAGPEAKLLAELTVGAILFRETMAPDLRAQCVLHGADDSGRIAIDAQPEGRTRGLIARAKGASAVVLGDGAQLEMVRTLPQQRGFRGVVEVPPGASTAQALMEYMQSSEQIVTMIAIAARFDGEGATLSRALGYLVQLTPETRPEPLRIMTERLPSFESIDERARDLEETPHTLAAKLLEGLDFEVTSEERVAFACNCSAERVLASVSSLPRADIEELLSAGSSVSLTCDYCNQSYEVSLAQLRALLDRS
jgi:molecular chaperone Hsp33